MSYRNLPIEEDSIPLRLVDRTPQPRALGELIVGQEGLRTRFARWLGRLHRGLFEEVKRMAGNKGVFDWETLAKYDDLSSVVHFLPTKVVLEAVGVKQAVEALGLPRVIQEVGPDQYLAALEASMTPEQFQALLASKAAKPGGV